MRPNLLQGPVKVYHDGLTHVYVLPKNRCVRSPGLWYGTSTTNRKSLIGVNNDTGKTCRL